MHRGDDIGRLLSSAVARHEAGQLAEAEALYAEILRQDGRQPDALNLMAVLTAQNGRIDRALELIRAAIVEQPENHHFRFNHGHILELSGSPSAVAAYREALTIEPHHLPALINLGNLLLASDRIGEAIDCFNRAITVEPSFAPAHEGLGVALQRRHDLAGALAAFESARGLDPDGVESNANLGALLIELGRAAEATPYLRRALQRAPERSELWSTLATALLEQGDIQGAHEAAREALARAPQSSRATAVLGLVLASGADPDGAAKLFDPQERVRISHLVTVPGFADVKSFNAALAERILGHPSLKRTALGARSGELRDDDDPAVQSLVSTVDAQIHGYLASLDGHDPWAPARLERWRLSLTATVLGAFAGEEPRIDAMSRLSGHYTVCVPSPEAGEPEAASGVLAFGQPPSRLAALPLPRRSIAPRPGQLLVFPSYLWRAAAPFAPASDDTASDDTASDEAAPAIAVSVQVLPEGS